MTKQTICLNMIVKNESHIIEKTLENIYSYIKFDYWVVSDTGSTDNTKEIITNFFSKKCVSGEFYDSEWQDFGYNRSKALEGAYNKTDYVFVWDADDIIFGNFKLPDILEHDSYKFIFSNNSNSISYSRSQLFNNRKKWKYIGVLHEYPSCDEKCNSEFSITGDYYFSSNRTGNRSQDPLKYAKDAEILEKAFIKCYENKDPIYNRYAFYCAQSYRDANMPDKAIEYYKKVLTLDNWGQEKYVSCMNIYNLYEAKQNVDIGIFYLIESYKYDKTRVECIYQLVKHYCINNLNDVAFSFYLLIQNDFENNFLNFNLANYLFASPLDYEFYLPYYMIIVSERLKKYDVGIKMYHNIFNKKPLSVGEWWLNNLFSNLQFFIDKVPKTDILFFKNCDEYLSLLNKNNFNLTFNINIIQKYIDCGLDVDILLNIYGLKVNDYNSYKQILINKSLSDQESPFILIKMLIKKLLSYKDNINNDADNLSLFYAIDTIIFKNSENIIPEMTDLWNLLFTKNYSLLTRYNKEKVDLLKNKSDITIFISFTTCKRYDLFCKTVNSILNNWNDIEKIDYWFCVDDNSSVDDRNNMENNYSWIDFYMKNYEEKGHRQSMNIIWNKLNELKPKYWIHMEDDFLFHSKMNYIETAIKYINNKVNIKQILFNRNYAEVIEGYSINGHIKENDLCVHDYKEGAFPYINCHYWPHYSFRPSLIDVDTILKLGNFDSDNQFFEMDYARKWTNAGYKSAFFNRITNRHIGRLTKDKNNENIKNAYDLNEEGQFQKNITKKFIKIINLERRPDRKKNVINQLSNADIHSDKYEFIKAVDGLELQASLELKILFKENDFGTRKGIIGCALSHYNLWQQLLLDDNNEYYVIMEDDITLCLNFKNKFEKLKVQFKEKEFLFIGYHMFEHKRTTHSNIYNNSLDNIQAVPFNNDLYIGGYFAYSINKKGAQILCDYIKVNGIKHGIDYLNKIMKELPSYECQPQLVFSVWNENGKKIDTDIQTNTDSLDFTSIKENNNIYINGISGLGNNLFQIATAIYYKEKYNNYNIILNKDSEILNTGTANQFGKSKLKISYLNTILNKFDVTSIIPSCSVLYNDCFTLNRLDLNNNTNIIIDGFCQNVDLFFDIKDKLLNYFNLDPNIDLIHKYKIDKNAINVMLGIRIGIDGGFKYSRFTKESYKQVLDKIVNSNNNKIINVYVISDTGSINCMIDNSDKYNIIIVNEDDVSQMHIGFMCNYFILSDSTFHWWIAFLKWSQDNSSVVYVFNNTDITNRCLLNSVLRSEWLLVDLIENNNFVFIKSLDYPDNDLCCRIGSVPILMDIAEKYKDCVGFNTLGFFKSYIDVNKLSGTSYLNENDGIYIKKDYYEQNKKFSLQEISEHFILDKCFKYLHNYIPVYEKYLEEIRHNIKNIFEIGIGCVERNQMAHIVNYNYKTGNSLRAWAKYCKNANIYGIDIFEESLFEEPRIQTFVCDQSNTEQLDNLMNKINVPMDVIVDDGSHVTEHQVISFMALEKYLSSDGIYIIEDIWNNKFNVWKQLSCFPPEYINYIKSKYDIFYYDQSTTKSNMVDCMCVFKRKIHFIFLKGFDYPGNDLFMGNSIESLSNSAQEDYRCVGYNTLGFLKYEIDLNNLVKTGYLKENDGIYIKKEYYDYYINSNKENSICKFKHINRLLRVKMLCNWCSSEQLCKEWSNMCKIGYKWDNIEITWSDDNIDYYVIINKPLSNDYYDPKKTILFQMEPWILDPTKNWGVKTWGSWANPDPNNFLEVRGRKTKHNNNAFWQLELTYQQLMNLKIVKNNGISSICSSKYFDEGHIARINLLKYIESKNDIVIDIYNYDNNHNFKNYKGSVKPYEDKSKGMLSYKYYFMIENNYEENFITEKLWEPILCESLVFYYGCPNLSDYINPLAYVLLDINDYEKSYQIIKKAIDEDWWSQRIDIIRQEKKKILNELSFFPVIHKITNYNYEYTKYFNRTLQTLHSDEINNIKKRYCFIHSCHIKEYGLKILNEIVLNILDNNLVEYFDNIFIINIGEKLNENMFPNDKIIIINYSIDILLFEIQTINLIRTFCEYNENSQILYLHTKGITHNNDSKVADWTNMMIYFLVNNCNNCIKLLESYDTVGCNYLDDPCKHYSGNFWWANGNYIKKLNKIETLLRHDAEWWLLSNETVNSYCVHDSLINHYKIEYPKEKYIIC